MKNMWGQPSTLDKNAPKRKMYLQQKSIATIPPSYYRRKLSMSLNTCCRIPALTLLLTLSVFCSGTLGASTDGQTINVRCDEIIQAFVERLITEELVTLAATGQARVKEIALGLCSETEKSIQQQHEQVKQRAIENWFFEYHPDKPGNRRLKKNH